MTKISKIRKKLKCDKVVDKALSSLKESMAQYEEDGKDNETSTTDVDNKTSEECIKEYNPTSDDDNEMDKTFTMIKNIHEPIKLPEVHAKSSISTINFNHSNDMTAMNIY